MPHPSPPDEPRRRSDGEATHAAILEAAMRLASIEGLGSLTIGRLARELEVSKSGVFAHFRSKERLQKETIAAAREVFEREVLQPGLQGAEGLGRLKSLCEAYLSYLERGVFPGGCFFAHTLAELDAPSGALHDEVAADHRGWFGLLEGLAGIACRCGELDPDTDPAQLAFELYAAMELANYLATLYRDPDVIERGRRAIQTAIAAAQSSRS
ncbi:MAG: TetR/AcrR family transcriptional regulator [Actinobacteria bacterium]|nr:TetR/AcrR family transcriptional regulator [Actinomycetota bacterium]